MLFRRISIDIPFLLIFLSLVTCVSIFQEAQGAGLSSGSEEDSMRSLAQVSSSDSDELRKIRESGKRRIQNLERSYSIIGTDMKSFLSSPDALNQQAANILADISNNEIKAHMNRFLPDPNKTEELPSSDENLYRLIENRISFHVEQFLAGEQENLQVIRNMNNAQYSEFMASVFSIVFEIDNPDETWTPDQKRVNRAIRETMKSYGINESILEN